MRLKQWVERIQMGDCNNRVSSVSTLVKNGVSINDGA